MRHLWRLQPLIALGATALTVIHPFIHGTPLDSGALDQFLIVLQSQAVNHR